MWWGYQFISRVTRLCSSIHVHLPNSIQKVSVWRGGPSSSEAVVVQCLGSNYNAGIKYMAARWRELVEVAPMVDSLGK